MQNLKKEQQEKIKEILKVKDDEKRLIQLKQYLSTCREHLTTDYAQLAYNIWLNNGGNINK